jgi:signal transduction histidine kinase
MTVTALAAVPALMLQPARPHAVTVLDILLLVTIVAAGWSAVDDDPDSAVGTALIGMAWLLPTFATWTPLGPTVRAMLLAAPPLAVAGVAVLLDRRRRLAIVLAAGATAVHVLTYDPFLDPDCERTCVAAPNLLSTVVGLRASTLVVFLLTLAAAIAAIRPRQRARLRLAGAGTAALTVAAVGAPLAGRADAADGLLTVGALLGTAAVWAESIRVRHTRRQVQHAVAQLAGTLPVTRGATGTVVAVHFTLPGDGRWLDGAGRAVPDDAGPAAVMLDGHAAAVRLVLGTGADPALTLAAISPASRLALQNARLRAAGEFQLAAIRASQRRIVEAADAERRRIERDLHDGAQQRLVAVTMAMGSAHSRVDAATARVLTTAEGHVRQALTALRSLSSESYGEVLAMEGLEAVLEEVAFQTAAAVEIRVNLTGAPLGWPTQRATVMAVAEGLDNAAKHAGTGRARISVADDGEHLVVRIVDDGRGGARLGAGLTAVADRAGALGGRFELHSPAGAGTTVVVTLPCA